MTKKENLKNLNSEQPDISVRDEEAAETLDPLDVADDIEEAEEDFQEKIFALEDALLRSRAELDNSFKRNAADLEKAHKFGAERLLNELLPVMDNLEHALGNFSDQSSDEDKEGIELTLKSFESALDKFGVSPIYPVNEMFDPILHEAVMTLPDEKRKDNEIENIFQRGWTLHDRVLRPARVSVIKN